MEPWGLRIAHPNDDPPGSRHVSVCQRSATRAVVNLCVGGMLPARTTDDPELRSSLRATARRQALALLETGRQRSAR